MPPPVLPEAAKQNTAEGFEAFTQYWFDTITYAREAGDATPLREASQQVCKMCQFQIDKAAQIHQSRGWSAGPKRIVRDFHANLIPDPNKNVVGYFLLDESGSLTFAADGSIVAEFPGGPADGLQVVYAQFDGAKWRVAEAGKA